MAVEYNGLYGAVCQTQAFGWLIRNLPGLDELVARNLTVSAASALTQATIDAGLLIRVVKETKAPWADLQALRSCGRDYLETLGKNTCASIRRSRCLYEEQFGSLCLSAAATLLQAHSFLGDLEKLHTAQWQARGKGGAFDDGQFRRFHTGFLETALLAGNADLLRVSAGKKVIGYLYNLLSPGGWVMAYQSGFAATPDNRWKPGFLSHAMAVQYYAARGAARYDFLAGSAPYKQQLAGKASAMRSIVAFAPRPLLMVENHLRRAKEQARVARNQFMRAFR